MLGRRASIGIIGGVIALLFMSTSVGAARFSSASYLIDASVNNSFGGQSGSSSYSMVTSGGEPIVGNGSSGSYMIGMGYIAQLSSSQSSSSLQLNVAPISVSFPSIMSGSPQTTGVAIEVQTDAPGYALAISQNHNLQDGDSSIPKISGTIGLPASWQTGATVGLGFTVASAPDGVPGKWSGPKFAQFPDSSSPTVFYTHSGQFSGTQEVGLNYRVDVARDQPAGTYTNATTVTGTMLP